METAIASLCAGPCHSTNDRNVNYLSENKVLFSGTKAFPTKSRLIAIHRVALTCIFFLEHPRKFMRASSQKPKIGKHFAVARAHRQQLPACRK
jgi:hypothetical protein